MAAGSHPCCWNCHLCGDAIDARSPRLIFMRCFICPIFFYTTRRHTFTFALNLNHARYHVVLGAFSVIWHEHRPFNCGVSFPVWRHAVRFISSRNFFREFRCCCCGGGGGSDSTVSMSADGRPTNPFCSCDSSDHVSGDRPSELFVVRFRVPLPLFVAQPVMRVGRPPPPHPSPPPHMPCLKDKLLFFTSGGKRSKEKSRTIGVGGLLRSLRQAVLLSRESTKNEQTTLLAFRRQTPPGAHLYVSTYVC